MKKTTQAAQYWSALGKMSSSEHATVVRTLLKSMDEANILHKPMKMDGVRAAFDEGILLNMREMPSTVQVAFFKNPTQCFEALYKIATLIKGTSQVRKYYLDTATHLLHDEEIVFISPDFTRWTGLRLSDFLTYKYGLHKDGAVDERLLDYEKFVRALVNACGYDTRQHHVSLWHTMPTSTNTYPGDNEHNAVTDAESWVSAMIEEQNLLQDEKAPLEFHVAELHGE
ncbi:hypothetical protein N7532_011699 [Penicillium argentinense]|uniref:Uncharacterized protein n=1 Tax=Penicillium argentinense TaxID=1131581 RepID=A0A9W9EIV6_9EURO|nr:uncharacterized protein N7532_011699 [Penicillium argentinense]KAJ5082656.1 hypothetical protein N7532_011699 [Penicillium argentinense]